jgi:hypothetical protein
MLYNGLPELGSRLALEEGTRIAGISIERANGVKG